jgi:signal peptidase I
MASARRRRGRVIFWVCFGTCVLAFIGGIVMVELTAKAFTTPSASMENTVRPGDHLLADRTSPIRRGDVIVAKEPSVSPGYFLRRVIGLPGDHVSCCDGRGRITVDGKALDETYLHPGDVPSMKQFSVTVPAGKLWLMGDHRSLALDSAVTGPVAVQIVGRVFVVEHSGHVTFLQTPSTFVADGLAPSDNRFPAAATGLLISGFGFFFLLLVSAVGVIRFAARKRREARDRVAAAVRPLTAPPSVPGAG